MSALTINKTAARTGTSAPKRPGLLDLIGLSRQRRALSDLDAHLLRDIGVTPDEARRESRRRFWDAPRHWRA